MRIAGKTGAGGYNDFAADGAVNRHDGPTATRLQPSAQRWSEATTLGERVK